MSSHPNSVKGGYLIDFVERMESQSGLKLTCSLACAGGGKNYSAHSKRLRGILASMRKEANVDRANRSEFHELLAKAERLVDDSAQWAGEYEGVCLFATASEAEIVFLSESPTESIRISQAICYRQAADVLASRMEMLALSLSFKAPSVYYYDGRVARQIGDIDLPESVFNFSEEGALDGGQHAHVRRGGSASGSPQIVSQGFTSKGSPRDLNEPIFLTEVCHAIDALEESKTMPLAVIGDGQLVSEFAKRRRGAATYRITNEQSHPGEAEIAAICAGICRQEQADWKRKLIQSIANMDPHSELYCDDLEKVLSAAEQGRVLRCLVAADCDEWCRRADDGTWSAVEPREADDAVEALNRIFIDCLTKDGEAAAVPQSAIPGNAKVVAVFRW